MWKDLLGFSPGLKGVMCGRIYWVLAQVQWSDKWKDLLGFSPGLVEREGCKRPIDG